ncbi:MAG: hypothetical protein ACO3JS_08915, partial [Steroidobacteraceae bacterium]
MDQLSGSAPVWRRATIMTTGLASAFLGIASAQNTDTVLEEVVITATKRETSLMLTPVAVSAFT